jgi:hypothetical protein
MKVGQKYTPAKWDDVLQTIRVDENPGTATAILFQDVKQLVR